MAVVFRARDERLGRSVALKILSPAQASDSEFRRRFITESQAAAAVDDPHIIPVYEAGEADGVLFIAMRYVAGGDLREVLEREGALSPDRAADFVSPVASALDAAHGAGLVHRDVKPGNILVDAGPGRPDHVYLSDFGIVKGALSVNLTGVGGYIGTPDYMAPEQISGRAVDGRTDQYSLACVAFQLLTGAVPFERDSLPAVIYAQLSAPPPSLVSQRSDLPAAADAVVAKAMAKTPDERYGSCGNFADALRDALGLASYHRRGPATYPPPGTDETAEAVVPDHPHATAGQDPRLPPRTATVVTAAGPEAAVANGRSTEGLETTGPTPAPPPRRPRWPLRRNRPAASMPPSTAATARDADVRDLPTSGQSRTAVPGGVVAPTAAAAVAEDQRTGDRGTIVPSAGPDPADVIAPVQADGRGGSQHTCQETAALHFRWL